MWGYGGGGRGGWRRSYGGSRSVVRLESARQLRRGDVVLHRHSARAWWPIRVSAVWMNADRSIVRVRLPSIGGSMWLDACDYELPSEAKPGQRWCRSCHVWETAAERRNRHPLKYPMSNRGMATSLREWSEKIPTGDTCDGDCIE